LEEGESGLEEWVKLFLSNACPFGVVKIDQEIYERIF
jgi:hypothetical protein